MYALSYATGKIEQVKLIYNCKPHLEMTHLWIRGDNCLFQIHTAIIFQNQNSNWDSTPFASKLRCSCVPNLESNLHFSQLFLPCSPHQSLCPVLCLTDIPFIHSHVFIATDITEYHRTLSSPLSQLPRYQRGLLTSLHRHPVSLQSFLHTYSNDLKPGVPLSFYSMQFCPYF